MRISIVIPSYNQGEFLGETIASTLNQNYPDLEVLVVDGGSNDASVEVIKKYEAELAWWVSEPDKGQSHAINKGFDKASGEIITWLNSDDVLLPGSLHNVARAFENNPKMGFVHAPAKVFGTGMKSQLTRMVNAFEAEQRLAGMPSPQPSYFFRRSYLSELGGLDEALHYAMDYDFFMRLALIADGAYMKERPLSGYRIHQASKTAKDQLEFYREWRGIFCDLINSANAEPLKDFLAENELWTPRGKKYPGIEKTPQRVLNIATGIAIKNWATFANQGGNMDEALRLLRIVRDHFPEVYRTFGLNQQWVKLRVKKLLPFR